MKERREPEEPNDGSGSRDTKDEPRGSGSRDADDAASNAAQRALERAESEGMVTEYAKVSRTDRLEHEPSRPRPEPRS